LTEITYEYLYLEPEDEYAKMLANIKTINQINTLNFLKFDWIEFLVSSVEEMKKNETRNTN
jgi:hypothetical protein